MAPMTETDYLADKHKPPPIVLTPDVLAQLSGDTPAESVDLSNLKLCSKEAKQIAQALKGNQTLRHLNLSNNSLTRGGAETEPMKELAVVLADTGLTSLDLSNNNLSNYGNDMSVLVALAEVLPRTTLTSLNLAGNQIVKKGLGETQWGKDQSFIVKLVEVLPQTSITSLNLNTGRLLPDDAMLLAAGFKGAPKLATVDFGGNAGIAGAEARAQILEAAGPAVAIVC